MAANDRTMHTLYISDEAYDGLIEQAVTLGYLQAPQQHARGLANYVHAVIREWTFKDTRPEDISSMDDEMRASGYAPAWQLYAPRRPRRLDVSCVTLLYGSLHAMQLGIAVINNKGITGALNAWDLTKCLSAMLEAIGTGWATTNTTALAPTTFIHEESHARIRG